VLGVDVGTTSTKVLALDRDGVEVAVASHGYPLEEPSPGRAEQDPDSIVAAVLAGLRDVTAAIQRPVAGLCLSTAMHGLMALDARDRPLTPLVTWADQRAEAQAERLRTEVPHLHRRTGTPLHAMSPLAKLVWFREHEPDVVRRAHRWVGSKEYVLARLCGVMAVDHSAASTSGLLDLSVLAWDAEALALAGVRPEQLAALHETTDVLPRLTSDAAAAVGLPVDTPVVVGATDGPLAALGLGALAPGVASCSIGTSAALRVTVDRPQVDEAQALFCYALTRDLWSVGGAVSNGGSVLDWLRAVLASETSDTEDLLAAAAAVPPGAEGLVMLPYLLGERAPRWRGTPSGAYVGLTRAHGRGHLVRAALEGSCLQLALVLQTLRAAGHPVDEVRATGGFARSALWRQVLADTLGMPVRFPGGHQGSALGAAMLGMHALGELGSLDSMAGLVRMESVVDPQDAAVAAYAELRQVYSALYDALTPAWAALRRLAGGRPQASSPPYPASPPLRRDPPGPGR